MRFGLEEKEETILHSVSMRPPMGFLTLAKGFTMEQVDIRLASTDEHSITQIRNEILSRIQGSSFAGVHLGRSGDWLCSGVVIDEASDTSKPLVARLYLRKRLTSWRLVSLYPAVISLPSIWQPAELPLVFTVCTKPSQRPPERGT